MALKSLIQLCVLFLLVFLGACSQMPNSRKAGPELKRFPAAADEQLIFSSSLSVKAHGLQFDLLLGNKEAEVGLFICDKEKYGLMLVKNGEIDLDKLKTPLKGEVKTFYSFESRRECAKFQEAIKFIDSGAPLIMNLDRERKRIITFFY